MLEVSHISKSFGSRPVIRELTFTVPEHCIYGFVGKNGAGKTTTMKMILGLLRTDGGQIKVNGHPVSFGQNQTNKYIGYLPDVPEFYSYMTPAEYLGLCGEITGLSKKCSAGRIEEYLQLVGLFAERNKRIRGFSRGMKQRLGIAQALINRPLLLICDEPTSALDPVGRKEILDILVSVRDHTTVLFSTHILTDVERICDRIGILNDGTLAFQGTLDECRSLHPQDGFEIEFHDSKTARSFAALLPGGELTGGTLLTYHRNTSVSMPDALRLIAEKRLCPVRIEQREPDLEHIFMEVIRK